MPNPSPDPKPSSETAPRWKHLVGRRVVALALASAAVAVATITLSAGAGPGPAPNTIAWERNCQYQFTGGAWRDLDTCRVMRSRTVYDTYRRSTRQWVMRIDESEPGWVKTISLSTPGAYWFKLSTARSQVLALINGRWTDVTNQLFPPQRAATSPSVGSPAAGECSANLPMYNMTEQQRRCNDFYNNLNLPAILAQQARICEQRRAAGPYAGLNAQQEADWKRQGRMADGWYSTHTGPKFNGC